MASTAAVPFWRSAGMTYITYSNICANLVRNCLKEPYKSEAIGREKVHFSATKWADGKPQKPSNFFFSLKLFPIVSICCFSRSRVWLRHAIGDSVCTVV
ncbi:putative H(+)-transporting two-sector ATPase [Helianthus anomalus]